jgi:cysteine desulfurase / selenocysteine lyase
MLDTLAIRKEFPLLGQQLKGKPIIYFDNACMSLRPQAVIDAITHYYTDLSACAGRSNHYLSQKLAEEIHEARVLVQGFLGAKKPEEIVFTRNTSEGLNLVARSLGLKSGDTVIISDKEHNSNLVPWQVLRDNVGINLRIVNSREDNTFDVEELGRILDKKVRLVSVVHTSNLDGVTNPLSEIVKLSHAAGALVMVDAAQSAPHQKLDVQKLDVDFLALSAHKLCGPSGMGVLYGKYELLNELNGFMVGGDTVEFTTYETHTLLPPPEKFEAGLQDYAGILGTGAAVRYLNNIGLDAIHEHEIRLNELLTRELIDIDGLHLIGPQAAADRGGIFSFYVDGVETHQISLMMSDMNNMMIRSGRHCVHSWFEARNIHSSARASLYFYNTAEEVAEFSLVLQRILEVLR